MSLRAFEIPAIEDTPHPEARLELVARRGEIAAAPESQRPAARLDVVPQHGLQPLPRRPGAASIAGLVAAALGLHAVFAVLFVLLLDWRVLEQTTEREIPVEIVAQMPNQTKSPAKGASAKPWQAAMEPDAGQAAPTTRKEAAPPPSPRMVAPPPEPLRAATQAEENRPANRVPDPPKPDQPAPPPVQAPKIIASAQADVSVPSTANIKADAAPQPKSTRAEPKPGSPADLTAALPMDFSTLPTSFRAVLSGSGARESEAYKGVVFGKLGRSREAPERARALHLRGQVIVSFSVDDQGRVADLKVAQTSGTPAVDAIALDMVREAAPFPPPPPGTNRIFTPALSFGDE